jgi:hypothetical protein
MQSGFILRFAVALSLGTASIFGQYSGGSSQLPGGYHSSTGIAIGAGAAAGVGIGSLVLRNHNRGTVVGCLQSASNASETLLHDNKNNTYALINSDSVPLKMGERVALRGKRIQRGSGRPAFAVHGLIKDYGQCEH